MAVCKIIYESRLSYLSKKNDLIVAITNRHNFHFHKKLLKKISYREKRSLIGFIESVVFYCKRYTRTIKSDSIPTSI